MARECERRVLLRIRQTREDTDAIADIARNRRRHALKEENVPDVAAIDDPLRHVDPSACNIGPSVETKRTPLTGARCDLLCALQLEHELQRRPTSRPHRTGASGLVPKNKRGADPQARTAPPLQPSGPRPWSAHHPQRFQQLASLTDEQLRVTDYIDEQNMADFD